MATRTISTRLAIEGESEYKAALKNISAELQLHKSELEKVEAKYKDNANGLKSLEEKQSALQGTLGALNERHAQHNSMLEKARQAQEKYSKQVELAKTKLDALKASTGASAEQEEKLTKELADAEKKMQEAGNSATYYQKQLNYTERDQAKFGSELTKTEKYLDEAKSSTDQCATSIDKYGKEVKQAGESSGEFGDKSKAAINTLASALAAAGVAATLKEIAGAIKECVDASIAFESAVTGVYKTVDGTADQLAEISNGIKQMATEIPPATTEIAAVAEAAGQLGIATDDVLSFSRVMLDLGESTNLSAEEAASSLAKFANITGTAAADYSRLGSVIVGLGNNFATTEADIVAMSTRLAGAGTLAGLTEPEIMALATAMSSVGIDAEAGGTAMTQTMTEIEKAVAKGGKGLDEFARIAGMSSQTFADTWETSAITAVQAFISGLGTLDEQGESAVLVLDELGLSGVRQSNMLKSLGLASDTLTGAISMSNQAWAENTALTDEANKRYDTTESKLAMAENAFNNVKVSIGDALAPALKELAEAGTEAFTWAAEFIEEHPGIVQALTGVTVALGLLVAGFTAFSIVKAITPLIEAFNLALKGNPAVIVAAAIAGLVVALGAAASHARKAAEEASGMSEAMREVKSTYEETSTAIQKESGDILDMMSTLEGLAGAEGKTAAQKDSILTLVNQLNEAVPGLSLAYNAQTDSLNLTTEAIKEMALAQANQAEIEAKNEYLTKLYAEQGRIKNDLAAANERLKAAEADLANGQATLTDGTEEQNNELTKLTTWLGQCTKEVGELTRQQETNNSEVDIAATAYNELTGATDAAARASAGMTDAGKLTAEKIAELTSVSDELTGVTKALTGAEDTLSAALKEQKEKGDLSLNTTLGLIDAGYAAAISIDTETGAITLNKDAYIAIAQAKIEEQIQAVETQRQSAISKAALLDEASAAIDAAVGYANKAKMEQLAERQAKGNRAIVSEQTSAYDAQIASLKAAKNSIGSYTGAVVSAAKKTSTAAKQVKTQAEKDLATYKELKATLDHEQAMADKNDVEAERRHYAKLQELRDEYLTDAANTEEYRRATEELHKYEVAQAQAAADEQKEINEQKFDDYYKAVKDAERAYKDSVSAMADASREKLAEIQGAYDDLIAKQDAMSSNLAGYGDLFTMDKDGGMNLEDLDKQIDAIKRYDEVLSELKERGISDSLLNDVVSMDVDAAVTYGQKLLDKDDKAWKEYNAKYEEKNAEAVAIAEKFYKDQLDTVETQYNDALETSLKELESTSFTSGQNIGQELTDGMRSKLEEVEAAANALRDAAMVDLSGLNLTVKPDGSHARGLSYVPYNGYIAELHAGERVLTADEAQAYIARSMPSVDEMPWIAPRSFAPPASVSGGSADREAVGDAGVIQMPDTVINLAVDLDGATVARKTIRYSRSEEQRIGGNMVEVG